MSTTTLRPLTSVTCCYQHEAVGLYRHRFPGVESLSGVFGRGTTIQRDFVSAMYIITPSRYYTAWGILCIRRVQRTDDEGQNSFSERKKQKNKNKSIIMIFGYCGVRILLDPREAKRTTTPHRSVRLYGRAGRTFTMIYCRRP